MPLEANLGRSRTFVTDYLPFMRTIAPSGKLLNRGTTCWCCVPDSFIRCCCLVSADVDSAMNNLYSYVRSNENKEVKAESENAARLEEQARILQMDDIVEDDDSSLEDTTITFADVSHDESAPKRTKLSQRAKKAPREVSLSPQEIIIIDD